MFWEKRKTAPNPAVLVTKRWKLGHFSYSFPGYILMCFSFNRLVRSKWLSSEVLSASQRGQRGGTQASPPFSLSPWEKAPSLVRMREGSVNVSPRPSFFQSGLSLKNDLVITLLYSRFCTARRPEVWKKFNSAKYS